MKICTVSYLEYKSDGLLRRLRTNWSVTAKNVGDINRAYRLNFSLQPFWSIGTAFPAKFGFFSRSRRFTSNLFKHDTGSDTKINCSEEIMEKVYSSRRRLIVGMMLAVSLSVAVTKSPSCKKLMFI